jgi:hypothetical protein
MQHARSYKDELLQVFPEMFLKQAHVKKTIKAIIAMPF